MDDSGTMTMAGRIFNVVAFAGSLRRASYNRALLRAATELAPPALRIMVHELDDIPFYNEEVEAAGVPPSVGQLRDAIRAADGLLIATPEYNYGVPGVLKNTIELAVKAAARQRLERQSRRGHGSLARYNRNGAQPIAVAAGIRFYRHVRSATAGGSCRAGAREVRRERSPCAPGDAGCSRDLSTTFYRSDRASRRS